jgi:hypothetical protein
MTTHLLRLGIPALLAWTAASCITFSPARTARLDPLTLERRGEGAFVQYLIPVSERVINYRVRSGPFRADEVWGPGVADRVACGGDQTANLLAHGMPVELHVEVRISPRSTGTRVYLDSSGHTVPYDEDDPAVPCRLNAVFAEELLTVIAGPGERFGPGKPTFGDPIAPPRLNPPRGGGPGGAS